MNIGMITCGIFCLFFLILSLIFTLLKEKAAMLVSGFNTLSKEIREQYDMYQISQDYRNLFLIYAMIFGIGVVLSYMIFEDMAILVFIIWLIVFFKDVHLDASKAFEKYKNKG